MPVDENAMMTFFVAIVAPERLVGDVMPRSVSGARVSIVILVVVDALVLPAGSVMTILILLAPSGREIVGVNE
jgi:hypothetical protein